MDIDACQGAMANLNQAFEELDIYKDLISYLRLIYNNHDEVSLRRIINVPKRGIGDSAIKNIENISNIEGISMFDALSTKKELEFKNIFEFLLNHSISPVI